MADPPIAGHGMTVDGLFAVRRFGLDYYQREYTWSRQHVRALLTDLHHTFSDAWRPEHDESEVSKYPPYYLGTLVYHEEDGTTYLVDGQQRVITLHQLGGEHLGELARLNDRRLRVDVDQRLRTRAIPHQQGLMRLEEAEVGRRSSELS